MSQFSIKNSNFNTTAKTTKQTTKYQTLFITCNKLQVIAQHLKQKEKLIQYLCIA